MESPQPDFGVFLEAIKDNIAKRQLQPVPWFIEKIIQVISDAAVCDGALCDADIIM